MVKQGICWYIDPRSCLNQVKFLFSALFTSIKTLRRINAVLKQFQFSALNFLKRKLILFEKANILTV